MELFVIRHGKVAFYYMPVESFLILTEEARESYGGFGSLNHHFEY
ncbi:hypothetical protein [Chryseobacterium sp. OV279]|nr:hypothetical protein [Chryseobacterium sp. OV279]